MSNENFILALDDFSKLIDLEPHDIENYIWLAITHIKIGNYSEAIRNCNKAIELDSSYQYSYYLKGLIFYETEDYFNAIENFDLAISLY